MSASRRWWIALGLSASVHLLVLAWIGPVVTLKATDVSSALHVRLIDALREPVPKASVPSPRPVHPKPAPATPAPIQVSEPSESLPDASDSPTISEETKTANEVVLPVYRVSRLPRMLRAAEPVYPEAERASGKEAQVVAEVVVDARGQLIDATIIRSGGPAFDAAVLQALHDSAFEPGYLKDVPVAVRFQVPYRFKLR